MSREVGRLRLHEKDEPCCLCPGEDFPGRVSLDAESDDGQDGEGEAGIEGCEQQAIGDEVKHFIAVDRHVGGLPVRRRRKRRGYSAGNARAVRNAWLTVGG